MQMMQMIMMNPFMQSAMPSQQPNDSSSGNSMLMQTSGGQMNPMMMNPMLMN